MPNVFADRKWFTSELQALGIKRLAEQGVISPEEYPAGVIARAGSRHVPGGSRIAEQSLLHSAVERAEINPTNVLLPASDAVEEVATIWQEDRIGKSRLPAGLERYGRRARV